MSIIIDSIMGAFRLMASFDHELISITLLSLYVSILGVAAASVFAIPLGLLVGLKRFTGKTILVNTVHTFMGLPPVIVGLFLFLIFSKKGLLGGTGLLFTPEIMALAQFIIAFPIIMGVTVSSTKVIDQGMMEFITSLGVTPFQRFKIYISEMRYGISTAFAAGLGRALSEVGAVIIVGGNIRYQTRVLTTAIVLETSRGEFERAMALGIILISLSFAVNYAVSHFMERDAI